MLHFSFIVISEWDSGPFLGNWVFLWSEEKSLSVILNPQKQSAKERPTVSFIDPLWWEMCGHGEVEKQRADTVMFFWGSTKGEAVTLEGRAGAQGPLQMEQPKAVQKFTGGKEKDTFDRGKACVLGDAEGAGRRWSEMRLGEGTQTGHTRLSSHVRRS